MAFSQIKNLQNLNFDLKNLSEQISILEGNLSELESQISNESQFNENRSASERNAARTMPVKVKTTGRTLGTTKRVVCKNTHALGPLDPPEECDSSQVKTGTVTCTQTVFLSEQERRRRHRQRLALRKGARKLARNVPGVSVRGQRQYYRDLKLHAAGNTYSGARTMYRGATLLGSVSNSLQRKVDELVTELRKNLNMAYSNLFLSCAHVPNVASSAWFIAVELVRLIMNLIPSSVDVARDSLSNLAAAILGARPEVRTVSGDGNPLLFSAAKDSVTPEKAAAEFTGVLAETIIGKFPSSNTIKNLSLTFNALCVSSKHIYTFASIFLVKHVKSLVSRISAYFGLQGTETPIFDKDIPRLKSLADYVSEVDRIINSAMEMHTDKAYLADVQNLFYATTTLKKAFMDESLRVTQSQRVLVMRSIDELSRWRTVNYHNLKTIDKRHRVPYHISFCGPPDQGKSVLTQLVAASAAIAPATAWIFLNKDIYYKAHTKYWDRYKGQEIIIRDDMCTLRAPSDIDYDDRKFLMDQITPTVLTVNMADTADKGMTSACKLLVSSTNLAYMEKSSGFQDTLALNRRRNMLVYTILDMSCPYKDLMKQTNLPERFGNFRFLLLNPRNDDYKITEAGFVDKLKNGTIPTIDIVTLLNKFSADLNKHFGEDADSDMMNLTTEQLSKLFISSGNPLVEPEPSTSQLHSACKMCTDDEPVFNHEKWSEDRYDIVGHVKDRTHNIPIIWHENVPTEWTDEDIEQWDRLPRCFKCGTRRLQMDSNLYIEPFSDMALSARECYPEECDCTIDHIDWVPGDCIYTGCHIAARGEVKSRGGEYIKINADEDAYCAYRDYVLGTDNPPFEDLDLHCAAFGFEMPAFDSSSIYNLIEKVYEGIGWTKDQLVDLCENIPVWVWCVIVGLTSIAGIGTLMALFKSNDDVPVKKVVEMTEDEQLLFESSKEDAKIAKATLQHVINQANDAGLTPEKTIEAYYLAASKGYDSQSRTKARPRPAVLPRQYVQRLVAANLTAQGTVEVQPHVMSNARVFTLYNGNDRVTTQKCLFTHGRQFVINAHTWRMAKPGMHFELAYNNKCGGVGIDKIKVEETRSVFVDKEDLAHVLITTKRVTECRDIRKHFGDVDAIFEDSIYTHLLWNEQCEPILSHTVGRIVNTSVVQPDGTRLHIPELIYMSTVGTFGDCGTVAIKKNKIVGLMIAATKEVGEAAFVPMTNAIPDLNEAFFDQSRPELAAANLVSEDIGCVKARGNTEHLGQVNRDFANKISDRSKIRPTALNHPFSDPHLEAFPITKVPPVMSLRDKRVREDVREKGDGPMQIGVDKFKDPMASPNPRHLAKAVSVVTKTMNLMKPGKIGKHLMDEHEVVNGKIEDGERVVEGINMATSMGVPFRNYLSQEGIRPNGKHDYFEETENLSNNCTLYKVKDDKFGRLLMDDVEKMESDLSKGTVPYFVAAENLKDETLKLSKIEIAKTRIFETLPCSATMIYRKYFGGWAEATHVNCVEFPISVGIAAQKRDWRDAALRMKRLGNSMIAGDYVNWDGKAPADVMFAACDAINNWYGDQYSKHRELLVYALVHQYMVVGKTMMLRHGGMSSGCPITSELNSLVNWLLLLCAIQEICEEQEVDITTNDLMYEFEFMLYGDDHVISVGEKFFGIVTFARVKNWMLAHGIGYTDSGKTENSFDYEQLEDITFLKRKFVKADGVYLAPLNLDSIRMSMMWWMERKGTDPLKILEDKKNSFESELVMHGKHVYEREVRQYNEALFGLRSDPSMTLRQLPCVVNSFEENFALWLRDY